MDHVLIQPDNVRLMLDYFIVNHLLADRFNFHIWLVLLEAALILQNRLVRHLLEYLFRASVGFCCCSLLGKCQKVGVSVYCAILHTLGFDHWQWLKLCLFFGTIIDGVAQLSIPSLSERQSSRRSLPRTRHLLIAFD